MSIHIARSFHALAPLALVAMLAGCSKADEEKAGAVPNPTLQAQAAQAAIASAQAAHDHQAMAMTADDSAAAPSAPMAMGAPGADSPLAMGGASTGGAPTGMARMLGQPPMPGGSSAGGGLPSAMGAPHLYHLGAETFFLDQATAIGLTSEQQKTLTALKENAATSYATTQRKIDQGEQDLWVLSASEAPDVAKVETKIGEIARRTGQQRMDFIRMVGKAVGVLSDAQRRAVATSQPATLQPAAMPPMGGMPPAPGASGMSTGGGAPPPGMAPGGMAAPGAAGGSMADAGSSGGMGHM